MNSMKPQPTQEFIDLCESLYGPVVDPYAVVEVVMKRQGDSNLRRNVERASNAVGITAGSLGLAAALKDPRLARGGKVSRALYRTGQKMPAFADKIAASKPRLGAALATGAVGTQVGNLGGDALIAGTLKEKKGKQPDGVAKYLVPTSQVDKRFPPLTPMKHVVAGLRQAWKPAVEAVPKSRLGEAVAAADKAVPPPVPKAAPKPQYTSRQQVKQAREAEAKTAASAKHQAQGEDFATMLNTNSGKAATGVAGAGALYGGSKLLPKRRQMEYMPDTYAKADGNDVVFKGQFVDFDDEKKQAFGWASVVKINGAPVIDRQGDYISIDDLEKAAYTYVHKSRVGGDMHKRNGDAPHKVSDMIESIVYTDDKCKALGLPDDFPRGWWVGYQIHDPETWDLVRKQGRTGFSIHGRGIRKDVDEDELMGAH